MRLLRRQQPQFQVPAARRVRDLEIFSSRLIRAGFAGDYHSAFHGRGIEFSQVREYLPGDDVRTIDWNVTARTGVPHVKEFIEERDLTVIIAVDVSASMAFGSVDWRKCDIAAELTAVFSFAAVENMDRVGLLLFSDNVRRFIPARRGRPHAQIIVHSAVNEAMRGCSGVADFDRAAMYLERVSAKRAVILVLSDYLNLNFERTMKRLNRRHDVIAVSINDPREERFPRGALARVVDAESGKMRLIDLNTSDVHRRAAQRQQQNVRRWRTAGVDALTISTAMPYDRELLRFFRERVRRIARR